MALIMSSLALLAAFVGAGAGAGAGAATGAGVVATTGAGTGLADGVAAAAPGVAVTIVALAAAGAGVAGLTGSRLDAEVLLAHCLNKERLFFHTDPHYELTSEEIDRYRQLVDRRLRREPVAYIVGFKEFWSLDFDVDQRVLIPRPETEILVEEVLKIATLSDNVTTAILEIGVGSGAISLALASEMRQVKIWSSDISLGAVRVAEQNARKFGLADRITFVVGDMVKPFSGLFNVIISNPPYIADGDYAALPEDVRGFEPSNALIGGPEGLSFHRELIYEGGTRLKKGGWLLLEIGSEQKRDVERIIDRSGLYNRIRFRTDYAGLDRVVMARRG